MRGCEPQRQIILHFIKKLGWAMEFYHLFVVENELTFISSLSNVMK